MARPRDEDVRDPILKATFTCVAQKGVSGLSMREVARLTGLSTGTVTHHFRTRSDLLFNAMEFGFQRLNPEFLGLQQSDTLEWLIHRYDLSDSGQRAWWQFLFALICEAPSNPEIALRLNKERELVIRRWRTGLDRAHALGVLREGVDIPREARNLAALGNGCVISQLILESNARQAIDDLTDAVQLLTLRTAPTAL